MLTTVRAVKIFAVNNETPITFPVARTSVVQCEGMTRCIGNIVYVGGPPVTPPTIEFSMNGVNWESTQAAAIDPLIAPLGYSWDIQIFSWKFVRVIIDPPIGSVRGYVSVQPTVQN